MPEAEKLLSIQELADFLGVKVGWIYRRCGRVGEIPYYRLGNHLRFRLSEIEQWLESQRAQPDSRPTPVSLGFAKR